MTEHGVWGVARERGRSEGGITTKVGTKIEPGIVGPIVPTVGVDQAAILEDTLTPREPSLSQHPWVGNRRPSIAKVELSRPTITQPTISDEDAKLFQVVNHSLLNGEDLPPTAEEAERIREGLANQMNSVFPKIAQQARGGTHPDVLRRLEMRELVNYLANTPGAIAVLYKDKGITTKPKDATQ